MAQSLVSGAARQFLLQKFGGFFTEKESNPSASATPSRLTMLNPDRLGVLIVNLGAQSLFVGLTGLVTANNGFQVAPNGGTVSMEVDEDYTFVTRELWGVSPGGASQLYILELVREIEADAAGENN